MFRPWIAAAVAVATWPALIDAQPREPPAIRLGAQVGRASASLGGDDARAITSRTASGVLAYLVVPVRGAIAVRPEVHLAGRGAHFPVPAGRALLRVNYIDVPLLLQFETRESARVMVHGFAGPYIGFRRGCEAVGPVIVSDPLFGTDTLSKLLGCGEFLGVEPRGQDRGAMAGVGLSVAVGGGAFTTDVRYLHGLAELSKGSRLRHRSMSVAVGYEIAFGPERR